MERIHIVKWGDTLEKIARDYGVTVRDLVAFHNDHSPGVSEIIVNDIPGYVKRIFIPPVKEKVSLEKIYGYNNRLAIKYNLCPIVYGVSIIIDNQGQQTSIKYKTTLRQVPDKSGRLIVELDRHTPTYINRLLPEMVADRLAEETASAIYPVSFVLNARGMIVGIHNYEEILNRWEKLKENIPLQWQGEWVNKYLHINDVIYSNEKALLKKLRSDWFISAFFSGIYRIYDETTGSEEILAVPDLPAGKSSKYLIRQTISPYPDESGIVCIRREGKCIENENNDPPGTEGRYFAKYFIDSSLNTIDAFIVECTPAPDKKIIIKASSVSQSG